MLSLKKRPRTRYHKKRRWGDGSTGRSGERETRRQRATCKRSVRNLHRNHSSEHNASKEGNPSLLAFMGACAISIEPECRSFARCFVSFELDVMDLVRSTRSVSRAGPEERRQPESLNDSLLRLCADQTIDQFSVFENQHRGNAGDLITRRDTPILINIQLRNAISTV